MADDIRQQERMRRIFGEGKATSIGPFKPELKIGMMPISAQGVGALWRGLQTRPGINPDMTGQKVIDFLMQYLRDKARSAIQGSLAQFGSKVEK